MKIPIPEPRREPEDDPDEPVVVMIRVEYPTRVYNVVASLGHGHDRHQLWYITGVAQGGRAWEQILDLVLRPALGEPTLVAVSRASGWRRM